MKLGYALLSLLNSKLTWSVLFGTASALRGGVWRLELREHYVSKLPVPKLNAFARAYLAERGRICSDMADERFRLVAAASHRILDFAPPDCRKLTKRLENWHTLDFAAFRAAVKDAFHFDIPLRERGEWETYLAENAARVRDLTARIEVAEREIDVIVYRLFDLSAEEIALLESSILRA